MKVFVLWFMFSTCVFVGRCADTNYLKSTIRNHFGHNRHHLVNSVYKNATKDFIKSEFSRFGLDATIQKFSGCGYPDLTGRSFYNVIGVLKGARFGSTTDKLVGIGAHYDTVNDTAGVDDNGAGVAAMLETVRQLTSQYKNFQNTVIFVAFDIEEYLFYVDDIGSQQFITNWLYVWLHSNYGDYSQMKPYGMIVLDTMMNYNNSAMSQTVPDANAFAKAFPRTYNSIESDHFQGDFLTVVFRNQTDDMQLASTMNTVWHRLGQPQYEIESFSLPIKTPDLNDTMFGDFLRSDHYHFWREQLPAIFITDSDTDETAPAGAVSSGSSLFTANLRGVMVKCYHHECDNLNVMLTDQNVQFLGKISDTMTYTIATMSGAHTDTSAAAGLMFTWELAVILIAALFLF